MIRPVLQGDAFLADVDEASTNGAPLNLWWLGQSGFLVQSNGQNALIDPYLSDSLTKKYANTEKPHVRMTEIVIAPERLDFVSVASSSHHHTDHLDGETLIPLTAANPDMEIVVPEANRDFAAERLHCAPAELVGIDAGGCVEVAGFRFHAVPAAHEELETDEEGRHVFLGYAVEVDGRTIYHSGDTVRYEGMTERLSAWEIDVAVLPINGSDPKRGVAGNLSGEEAARLAKDIGANLVIPCHYDMFEFNTVPPDEFVAACERLEQPYRVLKCGERWSG